MMNINPVFLFVFFAMGYVFGLLLRKPTAGKFIIFGFFGIFIYEPVQEAGLLASAIFLLGVIVHHISLKGVFEEIWLMRMMSQTNESAKEPAQEENKPQEEQPSQNDSQEAPHAQSQQKSQKKEKPEETHARYEEYVNRSRKEKADKQKEEEAEKQKAYSKFKEDIFKASQQDGSKKNGEKQDQSRTSSKSKSDNRSHEEILELVGEYTQAELKTAWRKQVKLWNADDMQGKADYLVKHAEEEMKLINEAYRVLKKKFE